MIKKSISKAAVIFWRAFFILFGTGILFLVGANFGLFGEMPSLAEIENPTASVATQIYADDGTLMGKFYLQDRVNIGYKDINRFVTQALIATEDERFTEHNGIDGRSLLRALFFLGTEGGASTITMQTAKNLFTDNWSTRNLFIRGIQKIKESIIAVKLERNFTKEEIITLYLNTVEFSDNVFGIRNAAKTFFQKEPDRLLPEEAATLIGMLKAPGLYNPRTSAKRAYERRNTVLDQMVRNGYLTEAQATEIKVPPIKLNYGKLNETAGLGPYFRMVLGEEMKKWCKEHLNPSTDENYDLYRDGLKIYTTINPRMQMYAEEAVDRHMPEMQELLNQQGNIRKGTVWKGFESILDAAMKNSDRWKNMMRAGISEAEIKASFSEKTNMKVFAWNKDHSTDTVMTPMDSIKYHRQMLQAGMMVMDPLSGEVKAWVGGIEFKTFKYDHVNVNTKRQVGSTIKPLLYSLAMEDAGLTPNTPVVDVQQNFGSLGQVPATGASCTGRTIAMSQALAQSRNCATAYILKQLGDGNEGAKRFVEFLKQCSIKAKVEPFPSIALGSCEISLYEMVQAYSMFPGKGFNVKPMYITRIEDRNGNVLQSFVPQRKEVMSDINTYNMVNMMEGVMKFGTGRRITRYDVEGVIAGKTGTTNDNSDAWFIGYTPQLIAGVWTGCDDRFVRFNSTSLGGGSSLALPIWAYFYAKASRDKTLGLDVKSTFFKPETMEQEINYDWMGSDAGTESFEGDMPEDVPGSTDYTEGQDPAPSGTAIPGQNTSPSTPPQIPSTQPKPVPISPPVRKPAPANPGTGTQGAGTPSGPGTPPIPKPVPRPVENPVSGN